MIAAREDIALYHRDHVVILRPTLRAASILERLHHGWEALFRRVDQFDTGTITAIIRTAASDRSAAEALLASFSTRPIAEIEKAVSAALCELLARFLLPVEDDDETPKGTSAPAGDPVAWSKVYSQLFEMGTGWLGWTPAETWNATPAEIAAAMKGHVAKLKAIHGSAEDEQDTPSNAYTPERLHEIDQLGHDPAFDRGALQALKARHQA